MAMLTIRSIEEDLKHRLRARAARAGRSMEEARCILRDALADGNEPDGPGRARINFHLDLRLRQD